jgi:uncharacterized 2Fe-2S/4Fe-4S cluster protein (DUF4445 family)
MSHEQAMSHFIDFEPVGRRGTCPAGGTLLDCARYLGVDLANLCGGIGGCGRCILQVIEGDVSEPTSADQEYLSPEEIAQGYCLACQTTPHGDCKVRVPPESLTSLQRTQVEGEESPVAPDPVAQTHLVTVAPPSLGDLKADAERLIDGLAQQHGLAGPAVDLDVLRQISPCLRQHVDATSGNWRVQVVVRQGEIIGLLPPDASPLGLAIDLGTTKIAAYLVDLHTGRTLVSRGLMNPQIAYGEDVIARIAFAEKDEGKAALLREIVAEALNRLAAEMCAGVNAETSHIVDAVIVGNTAMHHLFLGLPVKQLARAPYVPAVTSPLDLKARDLGLRLSPGCCVHLPANIAGYVGADHIAMLLATEIEQRQGVALAIDIGTNTEICLFNEGALTSASCASGPAFEGAHIKHGMRAASGAIERLRLLGDTLEYQTIGGVTPVGLCGSGILDAMAQLLLAGVLDEHGRMREHPRVREVEGVREFVLVDAPDLPTGAQDDEPRHAITFTQQDVRQLQLAKAAMRTGIDLLLETNGRDAADIDQVIIAGAFGTYIDVASAIAVGMLPDLPLDRFRQVGNAAGMGAKLALVSRARRAAARALAERIGYLELATNPRFSPAFARAMFLGQHPQPPTRIR